MRRVATVKAVHRPAFLVRAAPDRGVIRLSGELDLEGARALLGTAAERPVHGPAVTIDISELTFVDAAGLGALVTLRNRYQESGTRLSVTGASAPIRRIFALVGLVDLLAPGARAPRAVVTTPDGEV